MDSPLSYLSSLRTGHCPYPSPCLRGFQIFATHLFLRSPDVPSQQNLFHSFTYITDGVGRVGIAEFGVWGRGTGYSVTWLLKYAAGASSFHGSMLLVFSFLREGSSFFIMKFTLPCISCGRFYRFFCGAGGLPIVRSCRDFYAFIYRSFILFVLYPFFMKGYVIFLRKIQSYNRYRRMQVENQVGQATDRKIGLNR